MTKNEEKSANGNIKFKIKLIKIAEPPRPVRVNEGIYRQMKTGNRVDYSRGSFTLKELEKALADVLKK